MQLWIDAPSIGRLGRKNRTGGIVMSARPAYAFFAYPPRMQPFAPFPAIYQKLYNIFNYFHSLEVCHFYVI